MDRRRGLEKRSANLSSHQEKQSEAEEAERERSRTQKRMKASHKMVFPTARDGGPWSYIPIRPRGVSLDPSFLARHTTRATRAARASPQMPSRGWLHSLTNTNTHQTNDERLVRATGEKGTKKSSLTFREIIQETAWSSSSTNDLLQAIQRRALAHG